LLWKPAIEKLSLICLLNSIDHGEGHYWKTIYSMFSGLLGVVCQNTDVLVYAEDQWKHDDWLKQVLKTLEKKRNHPQCEEM